MKNIFLKIKLFAASHKIISAIIAVVILGGGYLIVKHFTNTAGDPVYTVAEATKGTIVSSVSGTGQVSASNQFDIKAKSSGDITSVNVKVGDEVKAGRLIASIDSTDASIALKNAQISLAKLQEPADASSLLSSQNSLQNAKDASDKALSSGVSSLVSTYLDMPSIINSADALFYQHGGYLYDHQKGTNGDASVSQIESAGTAYDAAKREYQVSLVDYQRFSPNVGAAALSSMLSETSSMMKDMLTSLKKANDALEYVKKATSDTSASATTAETNLASLIDKVTTDANSVSSALTDISSSAREVEQSTASLAKIQEGADPLDVESSELSLQQRQEAYNDSFTIAPFDGIVAALSVKKGDTVSSGASIGTFITKEKIAEITLNEVDVSKIKVGDKVTLTFDAVDSLSIAGSVAEINLVGTVSQGVVTYDVKIAFDTDDSRILPGMSVSAAIITDAHTDVLVVPSSAVKSSAGGYYVQMFDTPQSSASGGFISTVLPKQIAVEIGLSDDTSTEITSGLKEGDQVVTKTTTSSGAKTTTTSGTPSLFSAVGGRTAGAAGGATRATGR